jgi:hypothetical protein
MCSSCPDRRPRSRLVPVLFALAIVVCGWLCTGPAGADGPSAAPGLVKSYTGTLPPAQEGRRVWLKLNCYICHGNTAQGAIGPAIVPGDLQEALSYLGEGGMPAYHRYLNSGDVANLAAYLASIGTASEPTFVRWWEPVPSQ